jgi:microcystin-dependent protein
MSQPYLGQIMLTPYTFAPRQFAQCNGQLLPINQNQALFALLGTIYGGDGVTTFKLPDLRSRTPIGMGTAPSGTLYPIGMLAGSENVTLLGTQIPQHTHSSSYSTTASTARSPTNGLFGTTGSNPIYVTASGAPQVGLNQATVSPAGNNLPHPNIQPYLALNFCIALYGAFPARN